jgi:hypothetical protein
MMGRAIASRMMLLVMIHLCLSSIGVLAFQQSSNSASQKIKSTLRMSDEAPSLAGFATFIERKSRPDHIGIPRKRMELTFSVQLMRLSYAVVDDLDFVPMDEFQKDFFLFRQDEWEGDLADPLYFDFIR